MSERSKKMRLYLEWSEPFSILILTERCERVKISQNEQSARFVFSTSDIRLHIHMSILLIVLWVYRITCRNKSENENYENLLFKAMFKRYV